MSRGAFEIRLWVASILLKKVLELIPPVKECVPVLDAVADLGAKMRDVRWKEPYCK